RPSWSLPKKLPCAAFPETACSPQDAVAAPGGHVTVGREQGAEGPSAAGSAGAHTDDAGTRGGGLGPTRRAGPHEAGWTPRGRAGPHGADWPLRGGVGPAGRAGTRGAGWDLRAHGFTAVGAAPSPGD